VELRLTLGFLTVRSEKRIVVSQRKHALEFLTDVDLLACKPTITLIDNLAKLSSTGNVPFIDVQA